MKKNSKDINAQIDKVLKSMNIKISKQQKELLIQIFKFIIVGGIATLLDWIIYYILYRFIGINELLIFVFYTNLSWNAMLVKILATAIVMVFNFVTRKMFLEKN